ncbi:hypothetical protein GCM10028771_23560 [Nocardioides marmoraquaticus]
MTARGTRAAAPVRWIAAVVLVGAGVSAVGVSTGVGDALRVGAAEASDDFGASGAHPAVSSAATSSGTINIPLTPARHVAHAFTGTGSHSGRHRPA